MPETAPDHDSPVGPNHVTKGPATDIPPGSGNAAPMLSPLGSEPGFLVVISDLHQGKVTSLIGKDPDVTQAYDQAVDRAKHLVYVGDIYEMLHLPKKKKTKNKEIIRQAISGAIDDLDAKLTERPDRFIHFVLGNHENVDEFREKLDMLMTKHNTLAKNFEWHEEAIKIGNALFTHGDLQVNHMNDTKRGTFTAKQAGKHMHGKLAGLAEDPDTYLGSVYPKITKHNKKPKYAAPKTYMELSRYASRGQAFVEHGTGSPEKLFSYREDGKEQVFTDDTWNKIEHVFFGHTHIDFPAFPIGGKSVYNTGSATRGFVKSRNDLGFVVADLKTDGTLEHIISYKDYRDPAKRLIDDYERHQKNYGAVSALLAGGYAGDSNAR